MSSNTAEPQYWLTTTDNPFDPFTEWDQWYAYDTAQGYNTCAYLARLAVTAPALDEEVNEALINKAIDQIIDFNIFGNYVKVTRD